MSKTTTTNLALVLMRAMLAAVFVFHGSQKLFGAFGGPGIDGFAGWLGSLNVPLPTLSAYLAGSAEFFGGLALLTGVLTRVLSVPLAFTMLVAAFTAHSGFDAQSGGMEYPLTLAFVVAGVGLLGPGDWTLLTLARRAGLLRADAPVSRAAPEAAGARA